MRQREGTIRSVRDLLRSVAAGGRLMYRQPWQVSEANGWRQWTIEYRDGSWQAVDARIAVTAHRKGMVTYQTEVLA